MDAPGVPTRRAALRVLDSVLRQGQPLEAGLERAGAGLSPADRGLAHAIAAEVLRRLPDLDALIDSATQRPLPDDAKARFALRIALVQALALGTPHHAAIATVLPLVDGGPRKLVHGVFGALVRREAALPEIPTLPEPVARRWDAQWGDTMLDDVARAIAAPPPLDLTLRDPADTGRWVEELGGTSLMPGHVRLPAGAPITSLPGFAEGAWWVQDLAASIPARLIGPGSARALDLCAAPGGKTLQLAATGWSVQAVDISDARLGRVRENLQRVGLTADIAVADVLKWSPDGRFDAVLLDAPCSATGICRRHPDVLHRVRPAIVAEAAALQTRMLDRAAGWVTPGGMLVYATCSLERAEGEEQAERFLAAHPEFTIAPPDPASLPPGAVVHEQGWVRTFPAIRDGQSSLDGFFIVRMLRAPSAA